VRFEVSRVLDTIEQRLTTDATMAQAVVDVAEVARFMELDGGRGINLLRIGMVIDALGRYLHDGGALLYPVVGRELLGDGELTSKERMVLGRWADDGLIEVTPQVTDRVFEVAELAGLALISRRNPVEAAGRYPWLRDVPHRALTLRPLGGGALLTDGTGGTGAVVLTPSGDVRPSPDGAPPERATGRRGTWAPVRPPVPSGLGAALLARAWRCGEFSCPAFGDERRIGQPVPRMRSGVPLCPRHDQPLKDMGARPPQVALSVVVDGLGRRHFAVAHGKAVVVGRSPDDPGDVQIGQWLEGAAKSWISRNHVRLELRDRAMAVTDISTNGTTLLTRSGPDAAPERIRLVRNEPRLLGEWDTVELYTGVEVCRSAPPLPDEAGPEVEPMSVLADAPTVALRLPSFGA
jgi:hypothetical protein